jgi:hypothetical protein
LFLASAIAKVCIAKFSTMQMISFHLHHCTGLMRYDQPLGAVINCRLIAHKSRATAPS